MKEARLQELASAVVDACTFDHFEPMWARVIAAAALLSALLLFVYLRTPVGSKGGIGSKVGRSRISTVQPTARSPDVTLRYDLRVLSPALCGSLVFAAVVVALKLAGFYDHSVAGTSLAFLADPAASKDSPGAEMAGRAIWALTLAAVCIAALVVCWIAAGIWIETASLLRLQVLKRFTGLAVILIAVLTILGWTHVLPAFGSQVSVDMLCSTWARTGRTYLGPVTDGLNAVAIGVSVIVAGAYCLALASSLRPTDKFNAELLQVSRMQESLDMLLYASAAALIAGLLEVVATLTWSIAPFAGVSELKVQTDLCRTSSSQAAAPASSASASSAPILRLDQTSLCTQVPSRAEHVEAIDDLRRFARSIAIVFGAGFSLLLTSMFLPVALVHQRRVANLANIRPRQIELDELNKMTNALGLDQRLTKRVFNFVAALGPLAAGLLSTVFGV